MWARRKRKRKQAWVRPRQILDLSSLTMENATVGKIPRLDTMTRKILPGKIIKKKKKTPRVVHHGLNSPLLRDLPAAEARCVKTWLLL